MEELKSIVLLIDSDNTQLSKLEVVLREVSTYGRIVVKRAYGNWAKDHLKNWENELKRLAIKAQQQFDYVSGKNATDMALVIDAMNLLHKNAYDAFVIVSSDSDFTPLAIELHESGVVVMGVGKQTTPESFKNSCDEFIVLENLAEQKVESVSAVESLQEDSDSDDANADIAEREDKATEAVHDLLKLACEKYQDDDGYANICEAGPFIKRVKPDFSAKTFGFKSLIKFMEAFPKKYEIKRYKGKGTVTIVLYRCKEK